MDDIANHMPRYGAKGTVEQYERLDFKGLDKQKLNESYEQDGYVKLNLNLNIGKRTLIVFIDRMEAGYGRRFYPVCPICRKRREYLLLTTVASRKGDILASLCRECLDLNYLSQQATRGGNDYHFYKLEQIGKQLDADFDGSDLLNALCPERPKHMQASTYNRLKQEFNYHRHKANMNFHSREQKEIERIMRIMK